MTLLTHKIIPMTGFELKLWRRGMNWDQERAAEELGVSVRSYKGVLRPFHPNFPPIIII